MNGLQNVYKEHIEAYSDGGCRKNPGPAVAAVWFPSIETRIGVYLGVNRTNNEAEFEGLLLAMREAQKLGYKEITVHTDSLLMANQVNGVYAVRMPNLKALLRQVRLEEKQISLRIGHVPRAQNQEADLICNRIQDRMEAGETFRLGAPVTL